MLRFASSPTSDMHIGDLRVALFNYILAKQKGEDFIVRIDDSDTEKNVAGKDQEILETLGLFGIEYSQLLYQSKNFRFYSAMALQLLHEKKAFSCFCSSEWLQKKREEAKKEAKAYHYDDACRNLPAELVIDNTAPFTVRIARPDRAIVIKDYIQGEITVDPDSVDSFVIMNQDKTPTAVFACAIDDMLNDISLVVRSADTLVNAAKEQHIRTALNYNKTIEYAHLPEMTNAQNITLKELLEEGYLPDAILNYLISIGNTTPKEIFTLDEAIEWFSLENLAKSPVAFDREKLKSINNQYLKNLDARELSRYVGFADEDIGELARIYLQEVDTTKELKAKIAPIFAKKEIDKELYSSAESLRTALRNAPYFDAYDEFINHLLKTTDLDETELSKVLRILLTNSKEGPAMQEIYKYLKNYLGEIVK